MPAFAFFISWFLISAISPSTAATKKPLFQVIQADQIVETDVIQKAVSEIIVTAYGVLIFFVLALVISCYSCFCCCSCYHAREKAFRFVRGFSTYPDAEFGKGASRVKQNKSKGKKKKPAKPAKPEELKYPFENNNNQEEVQTDGKKVGDPEEKK
ncbi:hypothetical protein L596_024108 [Steinernema carpocapsae]|uniref:Nematode cuticle collagen N-terminal domain-containing protein n=1 Tax=Steinernema carpocapsae TaxID=34508 RepID=A0A4U5MFR0_STECR|nr:hypothetical protein L596_024108 [Steinernema carpocapsae]